MTTTRRTITKNRKNEQDACRARRERCEATMGRRNITRAEHFARKHDFHKATVSWHLWQTKMAMPFASSSLTGASGDSLGVLQQSNKEDILKTQFATREGLYKLMTSAEYSRPNRVGYTTQASTPVKVSFVSLPERSSGVSTDRICFNVGRELFIYNYRGVKKVRYSWLRRKRRISIFDL